MMIHVAHILVGQKFEAEDLIRKLDEGSKFEDLARKFSKCPSSAKGGDLGPVEGERLDSDFLDAAEALGPGEVSAAVRTRFGYHLIKRIR